MNRDKLNDVRIVNKSGISNDTEVYINDTRVNNVVSVKVPTFRTNQLISAIIGFENVEFDLTVDMVTDNTTKIIGDIDYEVYKWSLHPLKRWANRKTGKCTNQADKLSEFLLEPYDDTEFIEGRGTIEGIGYESDFMAGVAAWMEGNGYKFK